MSTSSARNRSRRFAPAALALAAATAVACGSGNYVWVQDLPSSPTREEGYVISPGDLVNVRVFGQEDMSTRAKVRRDGRIAVPFLGDVDVNGKRPTVVAREIEERLKAYVNAPRVTVVVEEFQAITVPVLGEVAHPGTVTLEASSGVLQALANAGGLTDYADRDKIFVLRRAPTLRRIRFSFDALTRNDPKAAMFALQGGDVVVVE
jgi:polysaccharide export outer membrane protein